MNTLYWCIFRLVLCGCLLRIRCRSCLLSSVTWRWVSIVANFFLSESNFFFMLFGNTAFYTQQISSFGVAIHCLHSWCWSWWFWQSNLKLDIEIQKIPSSNMIENVASYLKKGVSDTPQGLNVLWLSIWFVVCMMAASCFSDISSSRLGLTLTTSLHICYHLQKDSPVLYKFEVKKRQESTKQERQRVLCITKEYLIEKWADHVIGIHRYQFFLWFLVVLVNLCFLQCAYCFFPIWV